MEPTFSNAWLMQWPKS